MRPGAYNNNNVHIFQAPGYVALLNEHIHYEYACHEGNYGLTGILAGARRQNTQRVTSLR